MVLDTIFKERQQAPLHFEAKANNARFSAYCLFHFQQDDLARDLCALTERIDYSGTYSIALHESYRRESAIAMELILKAVIAARLEKIASDRGFPKHHKIPDLWDEAGLQKLEDEDRLKLRYYQMILEWAGRYIAPKDYKTWLRDIDETQPPSEKGALLSAQVSLEWDDFDFLYSIAKTEFYKIMLS